MRPSLTTLAGMTIVAGTLAFGGAAAATGGQDLRTTEPATSETDTYFKASTYFDAPRITPGEAPWAMDAGTVDAEERFADFDMIFPDGSLGTVEIDTRTVNTPAEPNFVDEEMPDWFEDGCPPCGMG